MIGADSNRYEPQLIAIYYERETDLLCGQRPVFVNKLMVVVSIHFTWCMWWMLMFQELNFYLEMAT